MTPVLGITFDLDDTLWCGKSIISKANDAFHTHLSQHVPTLAAKYPPSVFNELLIHFQSEFPAHSHDYTFLRKHTLRHCLLTIEDRSMDHENLIETAFQAFISSRSQPQCCFEGVETLFSDLTTQLLQTRATLAHESTILIGIITNGNCIVPLLPSYLTQHINFVISAESVGCAKPSPSIFQAAIAHFPSWMEPFQVVHVGDDYEKDIEGAKQFGFRTIWVNASWSKPDVYTPSREFPAADAIIRHVKTVSAVIRAWNNVI